MSELESKKIAAVLMKMQILLYENGISRPQDCELVAELFLDGQRTAKRIIDELDVCPLQHVGPEIN